MRTPPNPAQATVIGMGPVGSLLALELARRGITVDAFERRPDLRAKTISAGRSINLAVSARGIAALQNVALAETVLAEAVTMRGRMMHAVDGTLTFQPYGADPSLCIHSISRGGLNKTLLTAAEATGRVTVRFEARVEACDLAAGSLRVNGEPVAMGEGPLFGTDGSASVLRRALLDDVSGHATEDVLDTAYKELHVAPGPGGTFRMERNALHIWPRGAFMLIALPNFDGSFTVTLFMPSQGLVSFAQLGSPDAVEAFFATHFADVVPLLEDLTGTFFRNPTGQLVTVRCAPWTDQRGRTLLLGDAAHAIVPFFGQGMNAGFEDVALLSDALDAALEGTRGPWTEVLRPFATARKADTDAIAALALENFVEMRDRVADPDFLLQKAVEKQLERTMPGEYLGRYALVSFHRVPYRVALEVGRVSDAILATVCAGKSRLEDVDLAWAQALVRERLGALRGMGEGVPARQKVTTR